MLARPPSSPSPAPGPAAPTAAAGADRPRIQLLAGKGNAREPVLAEDALDFVASLVRRFGPRRDRLLVDRRARVDLTGPPATGPPPESEAIRGSEWTVAPPPGGLESRWVEIVGEPSARAVVRGLNSKADVFVADFEDLLPPSWERTLQGQWNLARAVRRSLDYSLPNGERFRVVSRPATLMVRPRALHRIEPRLLIDGRPAPAALFDLAIYAFHNARELVRCGSGPYFHLAKLEHYLEAQWWEDVLSAVEEGLSLHRGTVRATASVENLAAADAMDEMLFALRQHSAGLAIGRPGLALSQLKARSRVRRILDPGTGPGASEAAAVAGCSDRLVEVCHHRRAQAIDATAVHLLNLEDGGPSRPELAQELADKIRDVRAGYDGTWVAHPGAVPVVREFFAMGTSGFVRMGGGSPPDGRQPRPGASGVRPAIWSTTPRRALRRMLRYLDARGRGLGTVVVDGELEDASTAEIARVWVWLWVHAGDRRDEPGWLVEEEKAALLREAAGDPGRLAAIERIAHEVVAMTTAGDLADWFADATVLEAPGEATSATPPREVDAPPSTVAPTPADSVPM